MRANAGVRGQQSRERVRHSLAQLSRSCQAWAQDLCRPERFSSRFAVLALGLLSLALYIWIAWRYPLIAGLEQGRATWGSLGGRSLAAGLLHAAVYGILMLLYVVALRQQVPRITHHASRITIWLVWALAALILLFSYPGESLDVFDYLFRGRMIAEDGASPLAQSPTPFADRPFWDYITWRGQVDTYGPLWEYASGGVAWSVGARLPRPIAVTSGELAAYVTGYRLLAVATSGLCGLVVYSIVRRADPTYAEAALLAWLWNPLLLIATAVGAHNDVIMALFVLLALWLLQRQYWLGGLLALLLAAHVKLTALLLLPVVGFWLLLRIGWRRAGLTATLSMAIALPLSWLLYAPLGGWATLPRMLHERTLFLANSPADLLYRWLQEQQAWAEPAARQLAMSGATALFCMLAALLLLTMLRPNSNDADLWRAGLAVSVGYLLIGSFWFMPWYILWVLPLAALLPTSSWARVWVPTLALAALWAGLTADVLGVLNVPWLTRHE
ncbi:hypothetical protein HC891_11240 [Candidatus Gracilibacteria bacterium]|nr:hypothetical protein [Candidatus Gracilibacteria bacterium]